MEFRFSQIIKKIYTILAVDTVIFPSRQDNFRRGWIRQRFPIQIHFTLIELGTRDTLFFRTVSRISHSPKSTLIC